MKLGLYRGGGYEVRVIPVFHRHASKKMVQRHFICTKSRSFALSDITAPGVTGAARFAASGASLSLNRHSPSPLFRR